ncbi:hypothetical protein EJ08DRAFT_737726 [Tothia fuscella]|uniref:Uncharacterized protein n=1 Tax=Tothia fuscella TaxID=1048955 RepID=A0A9P4TUU5_9PEZI|nr:hypothetical protein EJ08DRAFT_737726 [Tothia fuscella]
MVILFIRRLILVIRAVSAHAAELASETTPYAVGPLLSSPTHKCVPCPEEDNVFFSPKTNINNWVELPSLDLSVPPLSSVCGSTGARFIRLRSSTNALESEITGTDAFLAMGGPVATGTSFEDLKFDDQETLASSHTGNLIRPEPIQVQRPEQSLIGIGVGVSVFLVCIFGLLVYRFGLWAKFRTKFSNKERTPQQQHVAVQPAGDNGGTYELPTNPASRPADLGSKSRPAELPVARFSKYDTTFTNTMNLPLPCVYT